MSALSSAMKFALRSNWTSAVPVSLARRKKESPAGGANWARFDKTGAWAFAPARHPISKREGPRSRARELMVSLTVIKTLVLTN
jgi:hypothetical protein